MLEDEARQIRSTDRIMEELAEVVESYNKKKYRVLGAESSEAEIYDGLRNKLSKVARARIFLYSTAHKFLPERIAAPFGDFVYRTFKDKDPVDICIDSNVSNTISGGTEVTTDRVIRYGQK